MDGLTTIIDAMARETMLFAAAGLLIGGGDDIVVDMLYVLRRLVSLGLRPLRLDLLPPPDRPGSIAVFVAAWDEEAVIGAMLERAVATLEHDDYRIYVGTYPNDPGTIAAARAIDDPRIRVVTGARNGPTTKADCLNTLWHALVRDHRLEGRRTKAVVLHDAEDLVHPGELAVFDTLIEGRSVVQLPVLPLVRRGSLVSGHYADEFAYAHGIHQPVRAALGAAMPLAGTGCAIATDMLAAIAAERGGAPFDEGSLTEDYELGLHVAERGGVSCFARVRDPRDDSFVAVRAYFPDTMTAAARQKARWMTGIALAGWDRTGWSRRPSLADHWMRMRDRRALFSVLVLAVAYCAVLLWPLSVVVHWVAATPVPDDQLADWLFESTALLLGWRLAMRAVCTWRHYGWREACWSLPRFFVGNFVALAAAPRALHRYLRLLRGGAVAWDKTRHVFPI